MGGFFLFGTSQVPAFKDGDVVVNESMAICDYLEVSCRMHEFKKKKNENLNQE